MPPKKKTKLTRRPSDDAAAGEADPAIVNQLDDNVIAIIFGCFPPDDIMRMRRVCKKWREAAKKTIADHFCVDSIVNFRAMATMTTALPILKELLICNLNQRYHKFSDGEDPDPNERRAAQTANYTTHDINIISNFRRLRRLNIYGAPLNGRYPTLFNFPLLEKLRISFCYSFKWELEMLSGFPSLRELDVEYNRSLRGNIGSLAVLKHTLEKVEIIDCNNVDGNFMDLADFPHLKSLNLRSTKVTGDIREITENDFLHLECIALPNTVIGGSDYQFQRISEVPSVMNAVYLWMRRNRELFRGWCWYLSRESPDWYDGYHDLNCPDHPFTVDFVRTGSRLGWRWRNEDGDSCEINWLDPEPDRMCDADTRSLQPIQEEIGFYKGYYHPPTAEEYNRLCDEHSED